MFCSSITSFRTKTIIECIMCFKNLLFHYTHEIAFQVIVHCCQLQLCQRRHKSWTCEEKASLLQELNHICDHVPWHLLNQDNYGLCSRLNYSSTQFLTWQQTVSLIWFSIEKCFLKRPILGYVTSVWWFLKSCSFAQILFPFMINIISHYLVY